MVDYIEFLSKYKNRKILIAPLNWGLGHASRCVPLIQVLSESNEVHIASDGLALEWLKMEFPELSFSELPTYHISYTGSKAWLSVLKSGPKIIKSINAEATITKQITQWHDFDLIISDHRLGVRCAGVESVIIAHQLTIPHTNSVISSTASKIQSSYINRFDACWIPDVSGDKGLSGRLSKATLRIPKIWIGPLSRLKRCTDLPVLYDVAVVLSGPEPARTALEQKLLTALAHDSMASYKVAFVRGASKSMTDSDQCLSHISFFDLADSEVLNQLICESRVVVSRSGYSTIMDLYKLHKKALLIPTPGQPEQEYLADLHKQNDFFISLAENEINEVSVQKALQSLLSSI